MCKAEKLQTSYEILSYLAEYPDAQDTLEGIVEWWLLERNIKNRMAKAKESLAELVDKGFVIERKGKDSRTHYRINRRKMREISVMLKRGPG
ncbi:MAG: hypothetical protein ACLGJB_06520 [Blastocatellia bacterium]